MLLRSVAAGQDFSVGDEVREGARLPFRSALAIHHDEINHSNTPRRSIVRGGQSVRLVVAAVDGGEVNVIVIVSFCGAAGWRPTWTAVLANERTSLFEPHHTHVRSPRESGAFPW